MCSHMSRRNPQHHPRVLTHTHFITHKDRLPPPPRQVYKLVTRSITTGCRARPPHPPGTTAQHSPASPAAVRPPVLTHLCPGDTAALHALSLEDLRLLLGFALFWPQLSFLSSSSSILPTSLSAPATGAQRSWASSVSRPHWLTLHPRCASAEWPGPSTPG